MVLQKLKAKEKEYNEHNFMSASKNPLNLNYITLICGSALLSKRNVYPDKVFDSIDGQFPAL